MYKRNLGFCENPSYQANPWSDSRGSWYWISSHALEEEVERNPNLGQRFQIKDRLTDVNETVSVGAREISRGKQLEVLGLKHWMRCISLVRKAATRMFF